MKRWFAMATQFTLDEKIEALGEELGPGGPLAVCVLLGQAKIQGAGGTVEGTFRDLAHAAFVERSEAKAILERADALGVLEVEEITGRGYKAQFPKWRDWQEAFRKQSTRETSADVRSGAQDAATRPPTETKTTTKTKTKQTTSSAKAADAPLSNLLADLIAQNGSRRPRIGTRWLDAERLLLERDERDRSEAERLIRWCQADEFWRGNILSMPKFRQKYDQLRLQAQRHNGSTPDPAREAEARRKLLEGTG